MDQTIAREIPFNYTSADDRRVCTLLLGQEVIAPLEKLVFTRRTGRSWRLLMRVIGDLFIHYRNPFLYQELIDDRKRCELFFRAAQRDLTFIADRGKQTPELTLVLERCRQKLDALQTELAGVSDLREEIRQHLGAIVGPENLFFDPFTLCAHATDATDWRLHLPVAVIYADQED